MNKRQTKTIIALTAAIFLLLYLISGRLWFRIDMTADNIFTISEVSQNLHREITDQLTITYFVSDRLVLSHPMPRGIFDLLREYAAHSRGRIRVIQRDPMRANLARSVEELGIIPWQIQIIENNEPILATVYSGILIEYMDRASVIPLVLSPYTLEYDLSSRIRALVRNAPRVLGVMVADAERSWLGDFSRLNSSLFLAGFHVLPIQPGEVIPDFLPALFVLGGVEDLSEFDLFLIDRYITGGGNVLFAVDGVFVDSLGNLEARHLFDGGLLAVLANYGALLRGALALDDSALNLTFQTHGAGGAQIQSVLYPHWISVREGNPDHLITYGFSGLDLYWASPLELFPPYGIQADVLFTTTERAWLQMDHFITDPSAASFFEDGYIQPRGTQILGAALSGVFPSAFEGHDFFTPSPQRPSRIIVIGDTDFASDIMEVGLSEARNLDFLIRSADWLSLNDDLLHIRGREGAGRLDRIADLELRSAVMSFSVFTNTVLVPLAVALAGFILIWRRAVKLRQSHKQEGEKR
ncbi:MAG: GldG family protein [Treponema sp.]|jgi:ABC-type uncharacterized transport system involved in gliding motility auxiliary subunit|nr:GldG family protein [Treponema sp.]